MEQLVADGSETIGVAILKSRGFFPYAYWYWIGVGALIGFVLLLNFAFTMALTYLDREYPYHVAKLYLYSQEIISYSATVLQLWGNLKLFYQTKILQKPLNCHPKEVAVIQGCFYVTL